MDLYQDNYTSPAQFAQFSQVVQEVDIATHQINPYLPWPQLLEDWITLSVHWMNIYPVDKFLRKQTKLSTG